ncbi:hypothetical protein BH20VER3_BH20VER3_05060 [soil metagenome]
MSGPFLQPPAAIAPAAIATLPANTGVAPGKGARCIPHPTLSLSKGEGSNCGRELRWGRSFAAKSAANRET